MLDNGFLKALIEEIEHNNDLQVKINCVWALNNLAKTNFETRNYLIL